MVLWAGLCWPGAVPLALQERSEVVTLARGDHSGIDEPRQLVVRTLEAWRALWREHAGGAEAPAVDFATSMVVAVFLGTRPTSGYQVEIVRVLQEPSGLVVEYRERRPPPGAVTLQVLTTPFHIARIDRQDGPVRFRMVAN
jgi:hypothetical protein